ncbi:MAG: 50S ribosomal protein L5 [bacterium]|nr:50S ribosomal protein L5 [bacterium]
MNLKEKYKKEIAPKMKEKFGYKNNLSIPKLSKVVLNVGVGRNAKDKNFVDKVANGLACITGQRPVLVKAKKSISAFKVREGMIIGVMVTLRNKRMYDFIDKLVNITFPRIRDFRGISQKQIDQRGNLSVGFKENLAFPEIKVDEIDNLYGVEVCISTTAKTNEEGRTLFKLMGFPFIND